MIPEQKQLNFLKKNQKNSRLTQFQTIIKPSGLLRTEMYSTENKAQSSRILRVHPCSDHLKYAVLVSDVDVLPFFDVYSTRMSPVQRSQQLKVMFS